MPRGHFGNLWRLFVVDHNDKDVLQAFGMQGAGMLDACKARDRTTQTRLILGATWLSMSY